MPYDVDLDHFEDTQDLVRCRGCRRDLDLVVDSGHDPECPFDASQEAEPDRVVWLATRLDWRDWLFVALGCEIRTTLRTWSDGRSVASTYVPRPFWWPRRRLEAEAKC